MKLPAKIRVNGYDCKFARNRDLLDVDGLFGTFEVDRHTITLAESDQFASELLEAGAVIHEWCHAMLALNNIKVPDEEALVEALETALVQGFRDNGPFVRSLLKALK